MLHSLRMINSIKLTRQDRTLKDNLNHSKTTALREIIRNFNQATTFIRKTKSSSNLKKTMNTINLDLRIMKSLKIFNLRVLKLNQSEIRQSQHENRTRLKATSLLSSIYDRLHKIRFSRTISRTLR
jgi:hypothetical protein